MLKLKSAGSTQACAAGRGVCGPHPGRLCALTITTIRALIGQMQLMHVDAKLVSRFSLSREALSVAGRLPAIDF